MGDWPGRVVCVDVAARYPVMGNSGRGPRLARPVRASGLPPSIAERQRGSSSQANNWLSERPTVETDPVHM